MHQARGNIFNQIGRVDAICITTNGAVKRDGSCVMGRGCAKDAARRWPHIPNKLGTYINRWGNRVMILEVDQGTRILSFPVKPKRILVHTPEDIQNKVVKHMQNRFRAPTVVPGWAAKAELEIIRRSAEQLVQVANKYNLNNVILPRPGAGAGELNWNNVLEVLENILDDRFTTYTF